MVAAAPSRRWRTAAVGVLALAGAAGIAACSSQTDAQPPVASVDFEPRVIVTVDDGGIVGTVGDRGGAEVAHGDDGFDLVAPAGSVVDLVNDATGPRRVVVTRDSSGTGDPEDAGIWLDTGVLAAGETVVLGLSAPGDYAFAETQADSATTRADADLVVRVLPRTDS